MNDSRDFFALQIGFAQKLAARFDLPVETALFTYTPFALHFERKEFAPFLTAPDPIAWVHQEWRRNRGAQPQANGAFHGHRLFGHFYFEVRAGHIIRPHLAPVVGSTGILREVDRPQNLADLRRMFVFIRAEIPGADTVLGNSWLYNLPAYRALFPPLYTQQMSVSEEDEFHYLALWGQFFERNWRLRQGAARVLLHRVQLLNAIEELRSCFPLQVLQPRCGIEEFARFYSNCLES